MKKKIIHCAATLSLMLSVASTSYAGGIPVYDGINFSQTNISAIHNIMNVMKQLDQYQTQVEQYKRQLLDSKILSATDWQNVKNLMSSIEKGYDKLQKYRSDIEKLKEFAENYKNTDFYKQHPCFQSYQTCTAEQQAELTSINKELETNRQNLEKALTTSARYQVQNYKTQATKINDIARKAQTANGTNELMQYQMQFLQAIAAQLLNANRLSSEAAVAESAERQRQADQRAKDEARNKKYTEKNVKNIL